ncbi:MAG TPA: phosphoribosyltransferase family protein [Frankiaceae bacterium]|nr:phosphoribosyltransferase family protein [Frankiaceae bacterium]
MPDSGRFPDRAAAGQALAAALSSPEARRKWDLRDVVVLGLPRGGVPVAAPVALALGAPLDVLVVRKLGVPDQPELAMGAIAGVEGSIEVIRNERVLRRTGISDDGWARVLARETRALGERETRLRIAPPLPVAGRSVVLVDDGLATGSTMRAAVAALRRRSPARVLVAVPIGAPSTCKALDDLVDGLVCLRQPLDFSAVGQAYDDFEQTTDDEVRELLAAAA